MSSIICILPETHKEKEVEILKPEDAKHYFDMQNRGYNFKEKLRIHRARPEECESCSA